MDGAGADAGVLRGPGEGGDRGGEAGGAEAAQAEREAWGGGAFDDAILERLVGVSFAPLRRGSEGRERQFAIASIPGDREE